MFSDLTFPHNYEINLEAWLPPCPGSTRVFYYPGADERGGHDGVLLEVLPAKGESWIGMFANETWHGASGVYSCPDPELLCVVSNGNGYIVRADTPKDWEELSFVIREVKILPEHRLLVFRDFDSLTAYGPNGFAWTTERLALDELTVDTIEGNLLRGRATVHGCSSDGRFGKWADYEVDLLTGQHQGGWE